MGSIAWGVPLTAPKPAARASKLNNRPRRSSEAIRAGHRGISWLHLSAAAVWLLAAIVLGAITAAGKAVPPVVLLISVAAAAGHGGFWLVHVFFATAARSAAAAGSAADVPACAHHQIPPMPSLWRTAESKASRSKE
jgi:hypothetical protein